MLCVQYNCNHAPAVERWLRSPLLNSKADVCLLQECNGSGLSLLQMSGWDVHRSSQNLFNAESSSETAARHFDAAVAVRKGVGLVSRPLQPASAHGTACLVSPSKGAQDQNTILFISAYLHPASGPHSPEELDRELEACLHDMDEWVQQARPGGRVVVAGDFNMPNGPWAPSAAQATGVVADRVHTLLRWMSGHHLCLITPPDTTTFARADIERGSTIDLVFSSATASSYHLGLRPGLDHFPAFFRIDARSQPSPAATSLSMARVDREAFPHALRYQLRQQARPSETNTWPAILTAVTCAAQTCRLNEMHKNKKRKHETPGWNAECERLSERRDRLVQRARQPNQPRMRQGRAASSLSPEDRKEYDRLSSELHRALEGARADYVREKVGALTNRDQWIAAEALRATQTPCSVLSPALKDETGALVKDTSAKLRLLARTIFPESTAASRESSEATTEQRALSVEGAGPQAPSSTADRGAASTDSSAMAPLTWPELNNAIATLQDDKAPGPDGLSPSMLKEAFQSCPQFAERIFQVSDRCIQRGHFPAAWKTATIAIIPKLGKRDMASPKSYRPISLLCTAAKVVDVVVCQRLQHALVGKGMLHQQYGGIPCVSTVHALAHVLESAKTAAKPKRRYASILSIDVAGAFNRISHDRLVQELTTAGLAPFATWIRCWLSQRTFRLRMEDQLSDEFGLRDRGVPQGSPLSPLLWAFYTESLLAATLPPGTVMTGAYVDDLFAVVTGKSLEGMNQAAQHWLDWVEKWASPRGLGLDKPAYLTVHAETTMRLDGLQVVTSAGVVVPASKEPIKLLGATVSSSLTMDAFVKAKCIRVHLAVNAVSRTIWEVGETDLALRLKLAKSILVPILDYGSQLHPVITQVCSDAAHRAEKAIWTFVAGARPWRQLPSGMALAAELGQDSHVYRWRQSCILFFAKALALPKHASSTCARQVLGSIKDSAADETLFGQGTLWDTAEEPHAPTKHSGPRISCLRIAARSIGVDAIEPISIPPCAPQEWIAPNIHILGREAAKQAEFRVRSSRKAYAVRAYCDGSKRSKKTGETGLGAAFVAFAASPERSWTGQATMDPERQAIDDAEMHAILLTLRSCEPSALEEGLYWKRVDVFSDSQHALQRLQASWAKDRKTLQYLTAEIRTSLAHLWRTHRTEVHFWWVPSHDDTVAGNKVADALAKEAALATGPDSMATRADHSSMATIRSHATKEASAVQGRTWNLRAPASILALGVKFSKDNITTFFGLNEDLIELLLQFRSNTLPTASHRPPPLRACSCSSTAEQSREHILLDCPELKGARKRVMSFLPPAEHRNLAVVLAGGAHGDKNTKSSYLSALHTLLRQARASILARTPRTAPSASTSIDPSKRKARRVPREATPEQEPLPPSPTASFRRRVIDLTGDDDVCSPGASTTNGPPPGEWAAERIDLSRLELVQAPDEPEDEDEDDTTLSML